jgi:hypothetical protein
MNWTVYTVEGGQVGGEGYSIFKTLWTEDGPVRTRIARFLGVVTREEADRQAADMQRSYDETRRALINE